MTFEVFGNAVKHCLECLIYLLNQSKLKLRRERRSKILKIIGNYDQISKRCHEHGFYDFLDELLMSLRIY